MEKATKESPIFMNPEMVRHLMSLTRMIYFVTEEEDRFLVQLHALLNRDAKDGVKRPKKTIKVWDPVRGLRSIVDDTNSWATLTYKREKFQNVSDVLEHIYQEKALNEVQYYVIKDVERILRDELTHRRILDIIHQFNQNPLSRKILIFVGSQRFIPEKLQRYFQVVYDNLPCEKEVSYQVTSLIQDIEKSRNEAKKEGEPDIKIDVPNGVLNDFQGLTSWEIKQAIAQSMAENLREQKYAISREHITRYKRNQITKTDLLQFVDVSKFDFDQVGGVSSFKDWVRKTKHTWTEKGREFGLKPPKGVLAVGVWGCGKSLSVKAMGKAWGLPVIQLEMGKLRSAHVGQSEANVYKALRIIDSVGDCIVWVDEAEKSFSGTHSSSQSDAGTTSRTVGILSTWIQERPPGVCLAMTANSVDTLPVEFVNRMDERFFFNLPTEEERIDILKIHLRKAGQDPSKFNLAELAEHADAMVGREIEQAVQAAMIDSFDQGHSSLNEGVLAKVLKTKPRIVLTMEEEIEGTLAWVGWDPDVQEGIRARFASPFDKKLKVIRGDENG